MDRIGLKNIILEIIQDVGNFDNNEIDENDTFDEVCFDEFKFLDLIMKLENEFEIGISNYEYMKNETIKNFIDYIYKLII